MDKNTLTGFVLMMAVFAAFFWLTKPSETPRDTASATAATPAATTDDDTAAPAVFLNAADGPKIIAAVRTAATHADSTAATFASPQGYTLSVDADGKASYTDADGTLPLDAILAADPTIAPARLTAARSELKTFVDNSAKYQGFVRHLGGENKRFTLENDLVKIVLSSQGAQVEEVTLKKYTTHVGGDTTQVRLFTADTDSYGFIIATSDQRLDTRRFNFDAAAVGDSAVVFTLTPGSDASWSVRYTLAPDAYTLRMEIEQQGMAAILPASTTSMGMTWQQKMVRNETGRTFEERNSAIYYDYIGEGVDDLDANGNDTENVNGRLRWVAFKNQFFSSVLIARDCLSSAVLTSEDIKKDPLYLKNMTMEATVPYTVGDGTAAGFDFYFGPNDYPILNHLGDELGYGENLSLTRLIPLGWSLFRWINTLIVIPVFTFLSGFISNYGIIILLLTIFIKLILFPFTYKSFKSQARMRVLAPEIKAINEKYPNAEDAMKRNQETMALYSRAGANPMSGCLPMMLQMPVLIAMFSFFPSAIELRGQGFLWAHDLSAPDYILTLPFTIPFYGKHVSLFCLLMTVINIIYMRLSMQNQPGGASMPGMKVMQYMMPVMFLFIFNDYASGLSYYYLLSLLITIIQTYVFRHCVDEDKVRRQMAENARKPRKKSGWMARLEEAQRQALAAQRQQQQQAGKRRR